MKVEEIDVDSPLLGRKYGGGVLCKYPKGTVKIFRRWTKRSKALGKVLEGLGAKCTEDFAFVLVDLFCHLFHGDKAAFPPHPDFDVRRPVDALALEVFTHLTRNAQFQKFQRACAFRSIRSVKVILILAKTILDLGLQGLSKNEDGEVELEEDSPAAAFIERSEDQKAADREYLRKSGTLSGITDKLREQEKIMGAVDEAGGTGKSSALMMEDPDALDAIEELSSNATFMNFIDQLGRAQNTLRAKGDSMLRRRGPDPHSIAMVDDFSHLLSSEHAMFQYGGAVKTLATKRLLDKESLGYEYSEQASREVGPFVILLDISGSMGGWRYMLAGSMAAAAVMSAMRQGRETQLVLYNDGAMAVEFSECPVQRLKELYQIATIQPSGGTHIPKALAAASAYLKGLEKFENGDVILVSDGGDSKVRDEHFGFLSETNAELYYLYLGMGEPQGIIKKHAKNSMVAKNVDPKKTANLVNEALNT